MKTHSKAWLRGFTALGLLLAIGCGDDDGPMPRVDGGLPMEDGAVPDPDGGVPDPDGGVLDGGGEHTGELTMGRLVVADSTAPTAWIFDLDAETPALLETLTLAAPARAYGTTHGRYAYLTQRTANLVNVIDSGIVFESHVDHYHLDIDDPEVLSFTMNGMMPTHFTEHDGWVAIFYDGSGDVDLLQERSLSAGSPTVRTLSTGVAHHGVAVAANGHLLATIGVEGEALPTEVGMWEVTALEGEAEDLFGPCPGLHGEAAAGDFVVFGCSDGVLVVEAHDDHFHSHKIDNPEGTTEGTRVGTLVAFGDVFIGNWGSEGFSIIDPEAETITPVITGSPVMAFQFDMWGDHLFAVTADGRFHRFESDGEPHGEPIVVSDTPFSTERGVPRPALTAGAGRMYLALPAAGQILEVHTEEWEIERTITIPGSPHSVIAVSVSPDWTEEPHDHDHEH
jgi:hypothetical protein